jgi:hypothetical protein
MQTLGGPTGKRIWSRILQFCDPHTLAALATTNRRLHTLTANDSLWAPQLSLHFIHDLPPDVIHAIRLNQTVSIPGISLKHEFAQAFQRHQTAVNLTSPRSRFVSKIPHQIKPSKATQDVKKPALAEKLLQDKDALTYSPTAMIANLEDEISKQSLYQSDNLESSVGVELFVDQEFSKVYSSFPMISLRVLISNYMKYLHFILWLAFLFVLSLKLDGLVSSWTFVFVPIFVSESLIFISALSFVVSVTCLKSVMVNSNVDFFPEQVRNSLCAICFGEVIQKDTFRGFVQFSAFLTCFLSFVILSVFSMMHLESSQFIYDRILSASMLGLFFLSCLPLVVFWGSQRKASVHASLVDASFTVILSWQVGLGLMILHSSHSLGDFYSQWLAFLCLSTGDIALGLIPLTRSFEKWAISFSRFPVAPTIAKTLIYVILFLPNAIFHTLLGLKLLTHFFTFAQVFLPFWVSSCIIIVISSLSCIFSLDDNWHLYKGC